MIPCPLRCTTSLNGSWTQRECARFMPCWSPFVKHIMQIRCCSFQEVPVKSIYKTQSNSVPRRMPWRIMVSLSQNLWKGFNLGKGSWRIDRPQRLGSGVWQVQKLPFLMWLTVYENHINKIYKPCHSYNQPICSNSIVNPSAFSTKITTSTSDRPVASTSWSAFIQVTWRPPVFF